MRKFRLMTLLLAVVMLVASISPVAMAATVDNATIDMTKTASLNIYKFDFTNAKKDGVWTEDSFVTTGEYEPYVNKTLLTGDTAIRDGDEDKTSDLGNGKTSNGYAVAGVEFTYLRVADIAQYTEVVDSTATTVVLYGFDKDTGADLLSSIGLADGANHYEPADTNEDLDSTKWWYTSDVLNDALSAALAENSTTVKNALEQYVDSNGGKPMEITDNNGYTSVIGLELGLYLLVETAVPEMVTSTVNPFFVSLPMTTVTGGTDGNGENSAGTPGGTEWNYDVTIYPKDETGIPTLEKTVRESKADTGKNSGSTDDITDGYEHSATASAGDIVEYQTITTLPTITSDATALTCWNFVDTLSDGLDYVTGDVVIEIFTDKECTDLVATWKEGDGKFTVDYKANGSVANHVMTVDVTGGLEEINGATENVNGKLYVGYSNYTMRMTYSCRLNSKAAMTLGNEGEDNKVVLLWKRTSQDYYDTLIDDCHVYSFGIDLTKTFKDNATPTADMYKKVTFKVYNATDKYYVNAQRNENDGVYYVTDHCGDDEVQATAFYPMTSGDNAGQIIIRGLEDDEYIITELTTYNGYTLLKEQIHVTITAAETDESCDIYSEDVLGVVQNDDRYDSAKVTWDGLELANIPQTALDHKLMSATATVRTDSATKAADATMGKDGGSENALAELTIVNTPGSDLPATGDIGTMVFSAAGVCVLAFATFAFMIFFITGKRRKDDEEAA